MSFLFANPNPNLSIAFLGLLITFFGPDHLCLLSCLHTCP